MPAISFQTVSKTYPAKQPGSQPFTALNKVSFRRKISEMDMLEPISGEFETTGAHRPAQLYRLKDFFKRQLQLIDRGL